MKPTISLNEMRERVARLIYGSDWIGGLTDEQYELLRKYPLTSRKIVRADGSTTWLDHIERCPAASASELDQAIGRQARMGAQFVTVDSWIEDHGFPVDPRRHADRKSFNTIVRRTKSRNGKLSPIKERRRGPKAKVLPRVVAKMEHDISNKQLSPDDLATMPDKVFETRYQAPRWSVRVARQRVLDKLKKQLAPNSAKK